MLIVFLYPTQRVVGIVTENFDLIFFWDNRILAKIFFFVQFVWYWFSMNDIKAYEYVFDSERQNVTQMWQFFIDCVFLDITIFN